MSSSDPGTAQRRFFAGVFAGLAGASLAMAATLLVVDPLGATDGNRLCGAGAKAHAAETAKLIVAHDRRPRTAIVGTSRVKWGFDRDALSELGAQPVVNLGVSGGLPANFSDALDEALAGGRLERAYIGVDFNLVHQLGGPVSSSGIAGSGFPRLERLRRAFFGYEALRSATSALRDCRPAFHVDGSPTREGYRERAQRTVDDERGLLVRRLRRSGGRSEEETSARYVELRSLIVRLRRQDVEVVLFSAPYRKELTDTFAEVGLDDDFAQFHAELSHLAHDEGAAFIDLHDPADVRMHGLRGCAGGGIACHYIDLTHYGPEFGRQIARSIAPRAGGPEPTDGR